MVTTRSKNNKDGSYHDYIVIKTINEKILFNRKGVRATIKDVSENIAKNMMKWLQHKQRLEIVDANYMDIDKQLEQIREISKNNIKVVVEMD